MGFRVVAKVMRESEETLARRLILLAIAETAHDDGIAWIDQETIASRARISRTHTAERIKEMDADGVIEIRKAQRGRRRINVYRVVLPGLDEPNYDRLPFALDRPFTTSEVPTPSEATTSDPPSDGVGPSELTASDPRGPRARDPLLEPSNGTTLEPVPLARAARDEDSSKPPKLTKLANGHDLAFDALAEVTGTDPSGNRAREVGIALNGSARSGLPLGIRALVANAARARGEPVDAGPEFEIDVAEEIRAKAARYRESMRGAMLTPLALAKWWTDLEKSGAQRDPAAEAFAEAQRLAGEGR